MSDFNDCRCIPRLPKNAQHQQECPEWVPDAAWEAWSRASRETNFELVEFTTPDFGLKKRQYIWEMMRHKKTIGDVAKAKAKENFENAVIRYAEYLVQRRKDETTSDHIQ